MHRVYAAKGECGATLVMVVIVLFVLISMAALSIDLGQIYIARQRAQNVCDAAALAGVAYLDPNKAESQSIVTLNAGDCAVANNEDNHWRVCLPNSETEGVAVSFPDAYTVRCDGAVKVNYAFAGIFGLNNRMVNAHAVARLENVSKVNYALVPLAVTDTIVSNLAFGQEQALKTDMWQPGQDAYVGSGNFSVLNFPGDSGGADYKRRLSGENTDEVEIAVGDMINTKPGNMTGPTERGLIERVQSDTVFTNDATAFDSWSASWDGATMEFADTPRLIIMPVIKDPLGTIQGRSEPVEIVGFAGFFIESAKSVKIDDPGGKGKVETVQITGRFVACALGADAVNWLWWMGPGTSPNLVVHARLVE